MIVSNRLCFFQMINPFFFLFKSFQMINCYCFFQMHYHSSFSCFQLKVASLFICPVNFADSVFIIYQLLEVVRLEGHSLAQEDTFLSRDIHLLQVLFSQFPVECRFFLHNYMLNWNIKLDTLSFYWFWYMFNMKSICYYLKPSVTAFATKIFKAPDLSFAVFDMFTINCILINYIN